GPYEIFFEMDADLSHDPRHLPAFLDAIDEGADVVLGSRNVPGGRVVGWGPGRVLLSRGGSLYGRVVLGTGVRDLTTGYKAFRRRVLETIDLEATRARGYAFQIEWTWRAIRAGFSLREVPITFVDRRAGRSKMSPRIFLEALFLLPRLRWEGRSDDARDPRG
ncbi:MAG: glycosyltransferase, partial [Planctomycetota bacterium]